MTAHEFSGFSPAVLEFLDGLEANNNKAWFEEHKEIYQQEIIAQVPTFVTALGERLQTISPGITYDTRTNGAGSMMRIYRDTRFSKDKTPYKTNLAFVFWEGPRKKMENPSFGLQFGTWGCGLYAGQWRFARELLPGYQEAVADDERGAELAHIIAEIQGAGDYTVEGEQYKRVPRGYPADHPRSHLLRYKGLHVSSPQLDREVMLTPQCVDVLFRHCQTMAPLQRWLVRLENDSQ